MRKFHDALADLRVIRGQIARGTQFRGYDPGSIAGSGMLAIVVASLESRAAHGYGGSIWTFVRIWVVSAVAAAGFIGYETRRRAYREHGDCALDMLRSAIDPFLPALVVGALLTGVLLRVAPEEVWMLPGLWELLISLGFFASRRLLPRPVFLVGAWYLVAGLACLALGKGRDAPSPWEMGVPFGAGQALFALALQIGYRTIDG